MILAIVGSVKLAGNRDAQRAIETVLRSYVPTLVISGGAPGIDTMAVETAKAWGIPVQEYRPRVMRWAARGGFKERNTQIAEACDALVRIVATTSTTFGSGWTMLHAQGLGKKTEEIIIDV